jgi:type IV pilus assembly protein PilY1
VFYVLNARTGVLLKKIDTRFGTHEVWGGAVENCNGLSTPQLIDVDNDGKVDYAYAGDLNGNMWKFDLTSDTIANWDVAYKDGATPKPLFQAKNDSGTVQPITAMPDIMRPCDPTKQGYFVIFGTGKYLGPVDFSNLSTQSIYGIWDYGDDADNSEYLGSFERSSTPELSNQPATVTLQEQTVIATLTVQGKLLRVFSDEAVSYGTVSDTTGQNPDPSNADANQVGWYIDLPARKERIVRDLLIRSGKVIIISSLPNSSPCSAGGESYLMELDACTGGRVDKPVFDINEDNLINDDDLIKIQDPKWQEGVDPDSEKFIYVAPTAIYYPTMIFTPSILSLDETELKLMSTAAGGIIDLIEQGERKGIYYWKQIGN